jgi:16S rRNA (guanine966-N2)-methyltransferase
MDPPYKEKNLLLLLTNIMESNILNKRGIAIIHRHKKEIDKLPDNFKVIEEKTYGVSRVIFGIYF